MRQSVVVVLLSCVARVLAAQGAVTGRMEGTITETVFSRSVRAATVSMLRVEPEPAVTFDASPDTAGHYRFDALPAGRYAVSVTSPTLDSLELALPSSEVIVEAGRTVRTDFTLPAGAVLRDAVCPGLALRRGLGVVAGRATDADSEQPITGAKVVVSWTEMAIDKTTLKATNTERAAMVQSGARGEYRLCGVPTGSWLTLQLQHEERAGTPIRVSVSDEEGAVVRDLSLSRRSAPTIAALDSAERDAPLADVDSTTGELLLTGNGSVAGVVRGAAGLPLADVQLHVRDAKGAVTTGADGRFLLTGLPEGTQILVARRIGYALAELPVELRGGKRVVQDVRLSRAVALDSVVVSAYRARYREFEFNRGAQIFGKFLTSDQIARRKAEETGDLLARLGGFTVVGKGTVARVFTKKELLRPSPCEVNVVVDGVQGMGVNDIRPAMVEGIEAYTGPTGFSTNYREDCGLIVIWSRTWRRPTRPTAPAATPATESGG